MQRLLFHFTSEHSAKKIQTEGITKGFMPWHLDSEGNPCLIRSRHESGLSSEAIARRRREEAAGKLKLPGFQWLTSNPIWEQPFAFLGNLPFPKNAYRITLTIPRVKWPQLHDWTEMCRRCQPDSAPFINQKSVDWENWFVFYGPIFPSWFVEIERNPGPQVIPIENSAR